MYNMPGRLLALVMALATGYTTLSLSAQQRPAAPARASAEASAKAEIETIQVKPNFYVIFGGGANVSVQTGDEGLILVDSGSEAMADKVLAAVKAISSQPIRYIINTSADADHVGGNKVLARAGVNLNPNAFNAGGENAAVLAHENVLLRMSAPTGQASPFDVDTWPDRKSTRLNSSHVSESRMPSSA